MSVRVVSPLSDETESIIARVIGCALNVHRELGPGFLEKIYLTALTIEFQDAGIPFEREKPVTVTYRGVPIPGQRVDLVVADSVIVEVKSVARFEPVFQARMISYLRTTGLRAGLIVNFNESMLKNGLRRIIL